MTWNLLFRIFGPIRPDKGNRAMDLELAHRGRILRDLC
jgi:hypothetical protein